MGFCVQSTKSFFTSSNNQFAKFVRSAEGQDKLAKLAAEGVFPLMTEVARLSGASDRTMANLETGQNTMKLARDVFGTLNIFRGIIPGMVERGKQMGDLVHGLRTGETVQLKNPKVQKVEDAVSATAVWGSGQEKVRRNIPINRLDFPRHYTLEVCAPSKHNDVAVGRTEMLLKLGENAGGMIGGATFIAGFGVARPAANARKYLDLEFGDTGHKIANSFPYIMFGNHIGGVIQNSCELAYQLKAYERGLADEQYDPEDVKKDFISAVVDTLLSLFEKILELVMDVFLFVDVAAPVWLKIPVGLGTSTLGLVRVWRKTQ